MAFTLALTNGAATSNVSSAKTATEIANFARLVVADKATPPPEGLTAAQLNQYYLDALRDETVRYWRQEARRNSLREKQTQANLEAAADADATL